MRSLITIVFLALANGVMLFSAPPAKNYDSEKLDEAWKLLGMQQRPGVVKGILYFKDHPDQTIHFFKQKLIPLKLDKDVAKKLLKELASDDKDVWKKAYETLLYLDPRLLFDPEEVFENAKASNERKRLVGVLLQMNNFEELEDTYMLDTAELKRDGISLLFYMKVSINQTNGTGVAQKVSDITNKPEWIQAVYAIQILESIANPEAVEILRSMATGHPDASPTIAAKKSLKNLGLKEKK